MSDHYPVSIIVICGGVHDPSNEKVGHGRHLIYDSMASNVPCICWTPEKSVHIVRQVMMHLVKLKFHIVVLLVVINALIMSINLSQMYLVI